MNDHLTCNLLYSLLLPIVDYVMTISRKCAQFCFKLYYFFMFGKIKRYEAFQLLFEEQETDVPPTLAYIFFSSLTRKYFIIIIFFIFVLCISQKKSNIILRRNRTTTMCERRGDGKSKKKISIRPRKI